MPIRTRVTSPAPPDTRVQSHTTTRSCRRSTRISANRTSYANPGVSCPEDPGSSHKPAGCEKRHRRCPSTLEPHRPPSGPAPPEEEAAPDDDCHPVEVPVLQIIQGRPPETVAALQRPRGHAGLPAGRRFPPAFLLLDGRWRQDHDQGGVTPMMPRIINDIRSG